MNFLINGLRRNDELDMIDLFSKMLSEITLWKTGKHSFGVLYHAIKAAWIKRKIIKDMNKKEALNSNDVYNCIYMINHSETKSIDFLDAVFETYISNVGASFHYMGIEEDVFITIHKIPNKKEFSRIDVDVRINDTTKHYTTDGLETERWPATVLLVILEVILRRLYKGSEYDD